MAEVQSSGQHVVVHKARTSGSWKIVQLVYWIGGVIEVLLAFRFGLKLFGANPDAGFVQIVYGLSAPFMAPFEAVFGVTKVEGSVFEWSALLAILVYAVIAWGIGVLIQNVGPNQTKTVEAVEHQDASSQTGTGTGA